MLRIIAVDAQGGQLELYYPQSIVLCKDENVPADSLNITFFQVIAPELAEISLYEDGGLVYHGVVDEQIVSIGEKEQTEIVSRSMTAVLLDNEACPKSFVNPDSELIFKRYLKPCGMSGYIGDDRTLLGEFRVTKGMSCYRVLEKFAKSTYGTSPRIEDDVVDFGGIKSDKTLYFSNKDGIEYTRLEFTKLRCKPVSRVMVKTTEVGEYSAIINNPDALSRNIARVRYLNTGEDVSATLLTADEIIRKSQLNGESVTLHIPMRMTDVLGALTEIYHDKTGRLRGFYVSSIRYTLTKNGEATKLTLRKKEN